MIYGLQMLETDNNCIFENIENLFIIENIIPESLGFQEFILSPLLSHVRLIERDSMIKSKNGSPI